MGVPKLFRWLSERYPCLSEKVQEWQIPEFDNLYLDMNAIIHNCSHPNDEDLHFRITEEQIFKDIFNYIDFLFKTIKPRKVMFMAIDGVAPRAKMNQQRSRRFRTAKEANDKEQEAIKKGETLPETTRFDSNCITPGTTFMIKLQEQLKYFVVKKVSSDEMWKNVKVYLSGHEAPGEGEHKIMDFIRYSRSQSDYDPYTRHCLYGLDADLIMLGSVSHEPYFSLLREEVRYVKTKSPSEKKPTSPEKINFYLLHLSILRDYLEIEFSEIKEKHPSLFNIENIIDDWVFMCILVGNDFIPHLPHYHINKNSLIVLFKAYIEVLPKLKGYLNEEGHLNLERLEVFFEKLSELEQDQFNEGGKEYEVFKKEKSRIKKTQKKLTSFFDEKDEVFEDALEENKDDLEFGVLNDEETDDEDESSTDEDTNGFLSTTEFELSKRNYYERKLNLKIVTEEIVREHTYAYIEALQWNLYYYYDGCQSWSWYYPYHYAPYVSDIRNFKNFKIKFPNDKPLLPFEQLLGVLPIASKRFLPESYQNVMTSNDSPLIGCYPTDFKLDQNGKQQSWEAVVLIPFIQEDLLLKASTIAKKGLKSDEKLNNQHGSHLLYFHTDDLQLDYPSSLPTIFSDITNNRAKCIEIPYTDFHLPIDQIKKGISKKIKLQTHFFGFPSLKFLKFTAKIKNEKVRVFETISRLDNVILKLEDISENRGNNLIQYLNKNIYFNWPYPKECKLVSLFDGEILYGVQKNEQITKQRLNDKDASKHNEKIDGIKEFLLSKRGIQIENETAICFVRPVIGSSIKVNDDGTISREKQYSSSEILVLAKTTMPKLKIVLPKQIEQEKAVDIYKKGSKCFILDKKYYGSLGEIVNYDEQTNKIKVHASIADEPDISEIIEREDEFLEDHYLSNTQLARSLDLLPLHVSMITGCVFVSKGNQQRKFNIGLNLKFNEKRQQIANYSKKVNDVWYFSTEVSEIIYDYMERFPTVTNEIFNYRQNELDYRDLFPLGDADAQFKELLDYLRELPTSKEKKQSIDAKILDRCLVFMIEEILQSSIMFLEDTKEIEIETSVKNVFCPIPALKSTHPDPKAKFDLYDRVVNVKQNIQVPQGLKGIVIGIEENENEAGNAMITVLFDEKFDGGLKINSKDNCCYVLPQCYLINISYGKEKPKSIKKNKEMFSCVLPPIKSRHNQKETFIAPRQKVLDPYYDESKNYWAKLNNNNRYQNNSNNYYNNFNNFNNNHHGNNNKKGIINVPNGLFNNNNNYHQNNNKSSNTNNNNNNNNNFINQILSNKYQNQPSVNQPSSSSNEDYQIVWNKLMASESKGKKRSISELFSESVTLKDKNDQQQQPQQQFNMPKLDQLEKELTHHNKINKKLEDKLNKYYSTKLKKYCKQNFKIEPKITIKNNGQFSNNSSFAQLNLPLPNELITITKQFTNLSDEQANEEICKLALNRLNKSTIKPPSFVLNKDSNLTLDFKLPTPPMNWFQS